MNKFKFLELRETSLLEIGRHTYRASYYSPYNTFGWDKYREKALKYLGVPTRYCTIGLGYIESIKGHMNDNIEKINLVFLKKIGTASSFPNIEIYTGLIENNIKCIILAENKKRIVDLYISENGITKENIKGKIINE